jgi:hypothetical protein
MGKPDLAAHFKPSSRPHIQIKMCPFFMNNGHNILDSHFYRGPHPL